MGSETRSVGEWAVARTRSGLYKSTDGGSTWKKLTNGLPTVDQGLGRIGFCISPSNSNRMYATVDAGDHGGIYRRMMPGKAGHGLLLTEDTGPWV